MYELSFQTPWHRPYRDGIHDSGGGGQGIFVDFVFHSPPPSSFWSFGLPWLTAWGSRSTKPQHTTRKPTGCASSFTSHSRPLSGVLLQVCAAWLGKTSGILQLNWSLASRSGILGNSCLRAPPPLRVSIPLCCLSVPPETRFPFLVHHCLPDPIVLFDGPFRVIQPGRKPFLFGLWKSAGGCSYW